MNIDVVATLDLLNWYLERRGEVRKFVICGGAALILRRVDGRGTGDIDVIGPAIDQTLRATSLEVARHLGLRSDWLNDKAQKFFAKDLPEGWEARAIDVYSTRNLIVQSLSDLDLAILKFLAECDRQKDFQDIVDLNLSNDELNRVIEYALTRDPGDAGNWPQIVNEVGGRLRRKMGYA